MKYSCLFFFVFQNLWILNVFSAQVFFYFCPEISKRVHRFVYNAWKFIDDWWLFYRHQITFYIYYCFDPRQNKNKSANVNETCAIAQWKENNIGVEKNVDLVRESDSAQR